MAAPRNKPSAVGYLRGVMVVLALLLPTLSLAVLGTIWLWQNDLLLIWSGIASVVALLIYGVELWLVRRGERDLENRHEAARTASAGDPDEGARPPLEVSPREAAARDAVEALAEGVEPGGLNNRDAILQLGAQTVRIVAQSMHPGVKDPLWNFTVPEALALVERVSGQLNGFVSGSVPFGDRLTVGQALAVYRWRGLAGVAEKAYNLWRILRFVNPASAIAGELRERVSGEMLEGVRTEFTRRLARAYVREVGQAAIDLYSGRLRPDLLHPVENDADKAAASAGTGSLEILMIGQDGAGRSSVINALMEDVMAAVDVVPTSDEFVTHEMGLDAATRLRITETPALDGSEKRQTQVITRAMKSADAIVWVVSAVRPDRAADVAALNALRAIFREDGRRALPPIVCVVTNVDRVRPFKEWAPPYDLTDETSAKSQSIGAAVEAVAEDLALEVEDIVPVAVRDVRAGYNIELIWARMSDVLDQARNVQLIRRLSEGRGRPSLSSVWRQALGAGRVLRKTVFD